MATSSKLEYFAPRWIDVVCFVLAMVAGVGTIVMIGVGLVAR
jgi:hypothetical protein